MLYAFAASALAQNVVQKADYSKSPGAVRLVAYNVGVFSKYRDDSTRDIAAMMLELDADAVAVSELDSCNRRNPVYQLEAFAEALGGVVVQGGFHHLAKDILNELGGHRGAEGRGTNSEGRIYEFRGLCPPNIRTRACAGGI